MRAEAASMISESRRAVAGCRTIQRRLTCGPGELQARLDNYRRTLATLSRPGDRMYVENRIAEVAAELQRLQPDAQAHVRG